MVEDSLEIAYNTKIEQYRSDFSILMSSLRQYESILFLAPKFHQKIGLDIDVLKSLLFRVVLESQNQRSRFHYQVEKMLPQARLDTKMDQAEDFKKLVYELLVNEDDRKRIDRVVDQIFDWYIHDYLAD